MDDDAPADPAPHPQRPVVAAARQPVIPRQGVDPPLDARPEPEPALEPASALVLLPPPREPAGLGQANVFDAGVARQRFILQRV